MKFNLSLKAKQTLKMNMAKSPTAMSLKNLQLMKNADWLVSEIPVRYMHLLRLISAQPTLAPIRHRILKDLELLQDNQITSIDRLHKRSFKTLSILDSLNVSAVFKEEVYTLNLSIQLVLEEILALGKRTALIEEIDMERAVHEAFAAISKEVKSTPKISIVTSRKGPIKKLYVKSYLMMILKDLLKSNIAPDTRNLLVTVSEGQEDICIRVSNEIGVQSPSGVQNFKAVSPLTRAMAKYFGGSISQQTMGICSSSYLHLLREDDSKERLPPVLHTLHGEELTLLLD